MSESNIKRIETSLKEHIQFIVVNGRVSYENIGDYKYDMRSVLKDADGYIIDLRKVEMIDSTGLGLLVNMAKHFIFNKNKMVILSDNKFVDELFQVTKLDKVFQICANESDAIQAVTQDDETYWGKVTSY